MLLANTFSALSELN